MPLLFTNAFFLAALAALGIPVIIHLLLKRKSQRMRFSTIRFFKQQDEQASSRRKLRNLLLLALRLLILALIVFAFARPYLPLTTASPDGQERRQLVVVMDRSLSLQASDSGGRRWEKAKQAARELVGKLSAHDRAALVGCADRATVVSGFAEPAVIVLQLANLAPAYGASDLAAGLREAVRLLALGDPKARSSIAVVSDLQQASVGDLSAAPIPPEIEVQVVAIGDWAAPNAAVVDLSLASDDGATPRVAVANYSDEALPSVESELWVDGKSVMTRSLSLNAGTTTNFDLALPALPAGWHSVEFRLRSGGALSADDSRFETIFVPEPIRVVLVEGRPRARSFEEQTFFVAAALDPAFGTTNRSASPFSLQKIGPSELSAKLVRPEKARPAVAVLPAQKALSAEARRALTEFVRGGGGLLLFVGDEVSAHGFNSDFSGLVPVSLRITETANSEESWRIGDHDAASPLFTPFRQPNSGNLALAQFFERFSATTPDTARVEARFDDGVPFLVAGALGTGRVLWANTSSDTSWSDWPKHKTFVPWLHQAVRFLAGESTQAVTVAGTNFVSGWPVELEMGSAAKNLPFRLRGPGGQVLNVAADGEGRLDLADLAPGVWSARDQADRETRRFSVNVPASEADLAALRPAEFQGQFIREAPVSSAGLTANLFGPERGQREFWRLLLLTAIALLFVETLFSNRSLA